MRKDKIKTRFALIVLNMIAVLSFGVPAGAANPQASEVSIGVIGMAGGAFQAMKGYETELAIRIDQLRPAAFDATPLPDLSVYDVLYVSFATGDRKAQFKAAVEAAVQSRPDLQIFCVGPPQIHRQWVDWLGAQRVAYDPVLAQYYGLSRQSMKDMLVYTLVTYCGRQGEARPPQTDNLVRIYHPEYGEFEDIDGFLDQAGKAGWDIDASPRVALGTWRHHLIFHQPKVVHALIRELADNGILAVCLVADDPGFKKRLTAFGPDLVIMTSHTRENVEFWERLGVPRIHALWFMEESIGQWRTSLNTGMKPSAIVHQVVSAEGKGATECLTAGGTEHGNNSGEEIIPIPDRIRRIVGRAKAWIDLARTPAAEKKVALITWDREADKGTLMSGPAHCLNAPRSMIRLLGDMQAAGYGISSPPADEHELLDRLIDHGRQMGTWEPGPLDKLARSGNAILIPAAQYRTWFEEKVPHWRRQEVIEQWGRPPGNLMVWDYSGEQYLVLPRIDMGNIVLMTQPPKGETLTASALNEAMTDNLLPPTHHYLATYFWLQEEFKPDALVHFGSHGSEWLFPGKQAVLSDADWSDILLGNLPNINPWLVSNIAEHPPCKRRARAVTIDFLPPPLMAAGLSDDLLNLESTIAKYLALEEGTLKTKFAETISRQVGQCDLDIDWLTSDSPQGGARQRSVRVEKLSTMLGMTLDEDAIHKISIYLHDLKNEQVPAGMHVLGEMPDQTALTPYLVQCMGNRFLDGLAPLLTDANGRPPESEALAHKAREILDLTLYQGFSHTDAVTACGGVLDGGRLPEAVGESLEMASAMHAGLQHTHMEVDNILAALNGRFIPPGSSGNPERNPGVVPTGRNMFVFNPQELPTRTSWELGTRLMRDYLETEHRANGRYPQKIAFSLVPFATYSDYGIVESQILYLLGVRPVWDAKNRVRDVELIPSAELGRPRIDVFISARSIYRDELPSLMKLLDKGIRLAASLDEADNPVFANSEAVRRQLEENGVAAENARRLSRARMFGAEPDEVIDSHNWFFYLSERTGEWESREDLLNVYLSYCKHVYTDGAWGDNAPAAFDAAIQGTETIFRSWYDNRDFVLANKFAWWVDGTLSLAVKQLTGNEPAYLFMDVRDPDDARIVDSRQALQTDLAARVLNPRWISEMMQEGYAGGSALSRNANNLLGWEIMREASVTDRDWQRLTDTYVRDQHDLKIREWFDAHNPHAFQELTVTLLESIRKEFWQADEGTIREVAAAYAESVARHGLGGGIRAGGNTRLEKFVEGVLAAAGTADMDALLDQYRKRGQAQARAPEPSAGGAETVKGRKMEPSQAAPPDSSQPSPQGTMLIAVVALAMLIVLAGFVRKGARRRKPGIQLDFGDKNP